MGDEVTGFSLLLMLLLFPWSCARLLVLVGLLVMILGKLQVQKFLLGDPLFGDCVRFDILASVRTTTVLGGQAPFKKL